MSEGMISGIAFGIFSPKLIKSIATVRITTSDLYDVDGYPIEGGVMDPRLGVVDPGLRCRTCGAGVGECPGHFGYLELATPVVHVLYTKIIHKLLTVTCRECKRILSKEPISLIKLYKNRPKKCPFCGAEQRKINLVKPYMFYENKEELTPSKIRERFEEIPDEDLEKIGFKGGRPEWLILTLLPIPPVTMRPSIVLEGGERSEDDLTHKLVDVVRINQSLKENTAIGAPEFILEDLAELLQYHVATYFDNELTGVPQARHRSGRPLKGLIQRLKGKEGRIRGNLLGKRVNFSARTVISPDPGLSIDEVGVPEVIAKELTITVYVNSLNLDYVKDLIKRDKVNYVTRPDKRKVKVTQENKEEILNNIGVGWLVDRQIQDGDISLFNRQPSLHRISIMAHKVRIMPYKTFRLSPCVCPPYNADFDGDEMNLHIPQTVEARAEANLLMNVPSNIRSPRSGNPIVGLDLDQISGIYLLTRKNVKLKKEEVCQLFASAGIDIDLPNKKEFTGKEVFSLLLPKNIDLEFKAKCCEKCEKCLGIKCPYDAYVKIEKGNLIMGTIDEKGVGAFEGKIISKIEKLNDSETVKEFIDNCGRLGNAFLMKRGFSIGLSDLDLDEKVKKEIEKEIKESEEKSKSLINDFEKGKLEILPGMTPEESLEALILRTLANGLERISNIVKKNIKLSDFIVMSNSGAKGSLINLTQMSACVGQETILGQRIKRGYLNRTLPHFKPGDLSPKSHGFVARGFKQGLTPFELFWNVMNGREGLMDKSLITRKSGYMQRRFMNALQDLKIDYNFTVRNSSGEIIQFFVGEDGLNPVKTEEKLNLIDTLGV